MQCASISTYPENLGSGGLLPAELGGRVCLFVCPSRYDARHRKPRRFVYALNLGGTGISPPDSYSYRSNFRFRSSFRSRSSSSSTASGDIFYCSGSRQLNHSSCEFTVDCANERLFKIGPYLKQLSGLLFRPPCRACNHGLATSYLVQTLLLCAECLRICVKSKCSVAKIIVIELT